MNKEKKDLTNFVNPIDKDKITENPGTLPYAHSVSGPVIKPTKRGAITNRAITAMEEQSELQMGQIQEQIQLLAKQAQAIQRRTEISRLIYGSEMNFQPLIGHTYFLYEKRDGKFVLSMVAPEEWGRTIPFNAFIAKVKLLGDHTWQILEGDESVFEVEV